MLSNICVLLSFCAHLYEEVESPSCQQWRTQEFFSGGVQQIQLRTEDREDADLGAVVP